MEDKGCNMANFRILKNYYAKNGLKIFPIAPNDKKPNIPISWKVLASSDIHQILYWCETIKDMNVGLPANMNDLFIIDIDNHEGVNGLDNFKKLMIKLNCGNMSTLIQTTPSGGLHLIYESDEDLKKVKNVANAFKSDGFDGIDIRTDGYVVCFPSTINGVMYEFDLCGYENIKDAIKPMPKELKDYILKCNCENKTESGKKYNSGDFFKVGKVVDKGGRDTEIFNYINYLYNTTKLNYDEITTLALGYNNQCFNPPLSETTIKYKVDKCFKRPRSKVILIKINNEGGEINNE